MTIDSTHPEYDAALPTWLRARDVLAGEDAVKAAGEKYLPRLDSQTDEEFSTYRRRAAFFNATARTLEEYLELVFRHAPLTSLADEQLRAFVNDCDRWGMSFVAYARRVVGDVLSVGRAGSLVLQDPPSPGFGAASSESGCPWVSFWRAEDILNWLVARVGGRVVLAGVVLREKVERSEPDWPNKQKAEGEERIRVLRLEPGAASGERGAGSEERGESGQLGEQALPGQGDGQLGEQALPGQGDGQLGEQALPGQEDGGLGEQALQGQGDGQLGEQALPGGVASPRQPVCVMEIWKRSNPPSAGFGAASPPSPSFGATGPSSPEPSLASGNDGRNETDPPLPSFGATSPSSPEVSGGTGPSSPGGFDATSPASPEVSAAIVPALPEVAELSSEPGWVLEERVTVTRDGIPLSFIPFVFHGPRHSRPEPDRLPLADIIAANLDHYRLDADYKHGLHFTALPTAWVSGFDKSAPLRIGSSTAWVSEVPGASAGFLEFSGAGLAHLERAMEEVERRMAQLGAKMLSGPSASDSSTVNSQPSTTLCGLGSIVASLNQSLSRVLQLAQWWCQGGELEEVASRVSFAMNTDLDAHAMSGEEITAVVAAWRTGAISRETMLERLKRGEVLPDGRSVAQERALIHGAGDRR